MSYLDTSSCACIILFLWRRNLLKYWTLNISRHRTHKDTLISAKNLDLYSSLSSPHFRPVTSKKVRVQPSSSFLSVPCDYPIRLLLNSSNKLNLLCLIAGTRTGAGVLSKIWVHKFLVECHVSLQTTFWPLLQGARLVSQGIDRWNDVYTSTCIVQKPEIYPTYQDEYPLS